MQMQMQLLSAPYVVLMSLNQAMSEVYCGMRVAAQVLRVLLKPRNERIKMLI